VNDWAALLRDNRYRPFWLALMGNNLGNWCVIASLPILVADRFGVGVELVLSLGLRVLPKILLAPVAGGLLRRFGATGVSSRALLAIAMLTAVLPWCEDFLLFQVVIAVLGTLDVFVTPGLLSLRGPVTPPGLEMAGNTLFSVADRLAKITGPVIGGFAVLAGFVPAFFGFGAAILLSALMIARLKGPPPEPDASFGRAAFLLVPVDFLRMVKGDQQLLGLLVCAVAYSAMLGGLRPFLFWANRDWYGGSDAAWTGLLAAQGIGALVGALLSGLFSRVMLRCMSAYGLTLVTGVMEGVLHLALLLAADSTQAIVILALASIPEILSTVTWFTAMQGRLSPQRQAVFFTFAAPLWDAAFVLGVLSAGLHAGGSLTLGAFWAMASLTATLPIVPLLVLHLWRR